MNDPAPRLFFADFSGLHSFHAINHAMLYAQPGDRVGCVMIKFPMGVCYIPLLECNVSLFSGNGFRPINTFPQPDLIRHLSVFLRLVPDCNPFTTEECDDKLTLWQFFPAADPNGKEAK